jgi:hypothetical protein
MRPRIGRTHKRLAGVAPDGLADLTRENFDSYEEHADMLVPLMESRGFNRVRVGSEGRRAPLGADVLRPLAAGRAERDLESTAGAVFLLMRPQAWRWLRETHHRPRPRRGAEPTPTLAPPPEPPRAALQLPGGFKDCPSPGRGSCRSSVAACRPKRTTAASRCGARTSWRPCAWPPTSAWAFRSSTGCIPP